MIRKTLLLSTLALSPVINTAGVVANNSNTTQVVEQTNEEQIPEACSIVYVGKNVSEDGYAYVARSGDAAPRAMNLNMQIFEHNELANVTTKSKWGFEYTFPSTTYRYISTPRNPSVEKGLHWEVSGINENGVAVSATLTCGTNSRALNADPFVETGISEDNIAQIVAATATSAEDGIRTVAKIIDEKGNQDANAIMVCDKDEAWYMELYSGHQYCAVKMPDDKIASCGNEFVLDKRSDFDKYICSKDYYNLPVQKGFAQYLSTDETEENFGLSKTYAEESNADGTWTFNDGCHMRTWIAQHRYASDVTTDVYSPTKKYPAFVKPTVKEKLSVIDVIDLFRDRFETVLNNPQDASYEYLTTHSLRPIGVEYAYQIHVMSVDPSLPSEVAAEEWICMSNSNYAPFVPLSAGVNSVDEHYTHKTQYYGFDNEAACCIYKKLNAICERSRQYYGLPVQHYIEEHEKNWYKQWVQLKKQIKDLSLSEQKDVLTNFCLWIQEQALTMSDILFEDLLWHIMDTAPGLSEFKPFVNLEYYSQIYGWNYTRDGTKVILSKDGYTQLVIDCDYTRTQKATITFGETGYSYDTRCEIKNDVIYLDYYDANFIIKRGQDIVDVNYKDYISPAKSINKLALILPLAIGIPVIGISIAVPLILLNGTKKKQAKAKAKQK